MALFSFVELLADVLILMIAPFVIDDSSGHCIVLIFSLSLCDQVHCNCRLQIILQSVADLAPQTTSRN